MLVSVCVWVWIRGTKFGGSDTPTPMGSRRVYSIACRGHHFLFFFFGGFSFFECHDLGIKKNAACYTSRPRARARPPHFVTLARLPESKDARAHTHTNKKKQKQIDAQISPLPSAHHPGQTPLHQPSQSINPKPVSSRWPLLKLLLRRRKPRPSPPLPKPPCHGPLPSSCGSWWVLFLFVGVDSFLFLKTESTPTLFFGSVYFLLRMSHATCPMAASCYFVCFGGGGRAWC